MAYPRNAERNKQLVALRKSNPKKYTFGALGEIFKIQRETAFKIVKRELASSGR